jgi:phosphosulfolactate synthase
VLDKGYSIDEVRDFLAVARGYVDIVKLGWGTAVVTPDLKEKIDLYQSNGVPVCFGGTLFEVCLRQQVRGVPAP